MVTSQNKVCVLKRLKGYNSAKIIQLEHGDYVQLGLVLIIPANFRVFTRQKTAFFKKNKGHNSGVTKPI